MTIKTTQKICVNAEEQRTLTDIVNLVERAFDDPDSSFDLKDALTGIIMDLAEEGEADTDNYF